MDAPPEQPPCAAIGCNHPDPPISTGSSAGYCPLHARLLIDFYRWLEGTTQFTFDDGRITLDNRWRRELGLESIDHRQQR